MTTWLAICPVTDIPQLGSRVVKRAEGDVAVFRTTDDRVFALRDECPHKKGPLSQGIVYGDHVACPLHNWQISLDTGIAKEPDEGCTARFPTKIENGMVFLQV